MGQSTADTVYVSFGKFCRLENEWINSPKKDVLEVFEETEADEFEAVVGFLEK